MLWIIKSKLWLARYNKNNKMWCVNTKETGGFEEQKGMGE
jgi:hypothetical protein